MQVVRFSPSLAVKTYGERTRRFKQQISATKNTTKQPSLGNRATQYNFYWKVHSTHTAYNAK